MKLIQEIKTYEDLKELLGELDVVLLEVSGKLEVNLADILQSHAPKFGKTLADFLQSQQAMTRQTAISSLERLKTQLDKAKVLELTVSVTPTSSMVSAVHSWALKNIADNVVVSFNKNPSIVAGAVVSYNGKYGDFSSSKKIQGIIGKLKNAS